jgi:hypothetical protein
LYCIQALDLDDSQRNAADSQRDLFGEMGAAREGGEPGREDGEPVREDGEPVREDGEMADGQGNGSVVDNRGLDRD